MFYFVEQVETDASEKHQMNYRFNIKKVLLKTVLIIYTKNDKQSILIKVCSRSTKQEVAGVQALTFTVKTVYDKRTKPRFERKRRG